MVDFQRTSTASPDFDQTVPRDDGEVYLIGAGIASLAAAAFLIRAGDKRGSEITILEESATVGGALDGAGNPEAGYVLRGGRMLERKYLCTVDLFASIPTLGDRTTVVRDVTGDVPGEGGLITFPKSSDAVPVGALNFAFIGQYCKMPDDTVFTVEYSICSAQTAVYALLRVRREPPPVYKGVFDDRVLRKAFGALQDMDRATLAPACL